VPPIQSLSEFYSSFPSFGRGFDSHRPLQIPKSNAVLEVENLLSVGALFDEDLRILSSSSRHGLSPLPKIDSTKQFLRLQR
jgi:hypothetical protein